MGDEYPELDLLAAFKARFGLVEKSPDDPPDTEVLSSAQHVYDNAIDVSLSMAGTKAAADSIARAMSETSWDASMWRSHELHPSESELGSPEAVLNFIWTMDLLNFSFWDDCAEGEEPYAVEYKGRTWTGYWSLVACMRRALDEDVPITDSHWWQSEECNLSSLGQVFRGTTSRPMPMLEQRLSILKEAGTILYEDFGCQIATCIERADKSAARLVNLLAKSFPCLRDQRRFEGKQVRFLKRAQIFVADIWACFDGKGFGHFEDIDSITTFADYRIPQMLHALGVLSFSPPLESRIRRKEELPAGHKWEIELRGCSVWAIELIRQHIRREHPELRVNSILIDFFLYDSVKERENIADDIIPHHRTRSIWY